MNKIYNVVWSVARQCMIVASEFSRSGGRCSVKYSSGSGIALFPVILFLCMTLSAVCPVQASTVIKSGETLEIDDAPLSGDYSNNGSLVWSVTHSSDLTPFEFSGIISGSGRVETRKLINGASPYLVFTGENTYTGGTYLGEGAGLTLRDNGWITGPVIMDNSSFNLENLSTARVLSGPVSGSGSVRIRDSTLTLSGDNSFTGDVGISDSDVTLTGDNVFGNSGNSVSFIGSTVNVRGSVTTGQYLTFSTAPVTVNVEAGSQWVLNRKTGKGPFEKAFYADSRSTLTKTGGGEWIIDTGDAPESYISPGISVLGGTLYIKNEKTLKGYQPVTFDNEGVLRFGKDQDFYRQGIINAGNGGVTVDKDATVKWLGQWSGSGTLRKDGKGTLHLQGQNVYSGSVNVNEGTLRVTGPAVGADRGGRIQLTGSTLNSTSTFSSERNVILGTGGGVVDTDAGTTLTSTGTVDGAGQLTKTGEGTLALNGNNTFTGNTLVQKGILAINTDNSLGNVSGQTVLDGGDLQITASMRSQRDVILEKDSRLIVDDGVTASLNGWKDNGRSGTTPASALDKEGAGTLIFTGDNSANTGAVSVTRGTLQVAELNNLASAAGNVFLGEAGTLAVRKTAALAENVGFTRQLAGKGVLSVDLGDRNKQFTLSRSAAGGAFTGTVAMDNGRFVLNAESDNVLRNASLQLNGRGSGAQGVAKLEGRHTAGGLVMNGGRLEVDYSTTDNRPQGMLTVSMLDVSGGGELAVRPPATLPNPLPVTGASLFDQDDHVYDQIVQAAAVKGAGTQLTVTDMSGASLSQGTVTTLVQNAHPAGEAYYNYAAMARTDGLYLGYGLTRLNAFHGQSLLLNNDNAADNNLGAILSGAGGFTISATGTVGVGNASSDYTGATDITRGSVRLLTDNGLGRTSGLLMRTGTVLDLNGNRQTVGQLNMQHDSRAELRDGALTVSGGGQVDGQLSGNGHLALTGGVLTLSQDNQEYTGTTLIGQGATARLNHVQGLGRGDICNEGGLDINHARGYLQNSLQGQGTVMLTDASVVSLAGRNDRFAGSFTISSGTELTAGRAAHLGSAKINNAGRLVLDTDAPWAFTSQVNGDGTLIKRGTGTLLLSDNNVVAGLTDITRGTLQLGGHSRQNPVLKSHVLIREGGSLAGYGTVAGNVNNAGTLNVGGADSADLGTLTVTGNYQGDDNSVVLFDTRLGNDQSGSDRLVVAGNTSGHSDVVVNNVDGTGGQTGEGIRLIDVAGNSAGTFTLKGRAVAGAYEYFLFKGGVTTPDDGDWYLRSQMMSAAQPDRGRTKILRPEAAGYLANTAAAGKLFNLRLEDREGRAENAGMWLRQVGSRTSFNETSGQLKTSTNSYLVQGGGELLSRSTGARGRVGGGVMLAYGKANSHSLSDGTGYKAGSRVDGYSAGIYGTWYQNADTLEGAYVDTWAQYSWLNAEVSGEALNKERYRMNGLSMSVESGYRIPVYQGLNGNVFITPQAQVIRSGITADEHREYTGTVVTQGGPDNIQTRLGVKVAREGVGHRDLGTGKLFTVYAEANWLNNSRQAGVTLDNVPVKQAGNRNTGELKLGVEGKVNKNMELWVNASQRLGAEGYHEITGVLGIKYVF